MNYNRNIVLLDNNNIGGGGGYGQCAVCGGVCSFSVEQYVRIRGHQPSKICKNDGYDCHNQL